MEAAERILREESVEEITARRLCREVGVTSANFYNHYQSLDVLLLEIAAKGFEARAAMIRRLIARRLPRDEALVLLAQRTVELSLDQPQLFRIMFGQVKDPSANPNYMTKADLSLAALTRLVYGADLFRPDDIAWSHDHCPKAYSVFAFLYGLAMASSTGMISNPGGTRRGQMRFVEALTRSFLAGLEIGA
jgi:AcrR family transcriptional regulator